MKNFVLLSVCMLLAALSVNGQTGLLDPLVFLPNSAEAQKMTKKKNQASINPAALEARNLVSDPSFKKIFRRDLATVSGTNNLPNGQLILKLNEPEAELGQLFSHYKDKKTIPLFSFYPYVSVSSNTDKEYVVATTSKFDPKIGLGGRIIYMPQGHSKYTYFFFEKYSQNLKTRVFIDKNDLLKTELAKKYKTNPITTVIKNLTDEISALEADIKMNEILQLYHTTPADFNPPAINANDVQLTGINGPANGKTVVFTLLDIEEALTAKQNKAGRISNLANNAGNIDITFIGGPIATLAFTELIDDAKTLDKTIVELKEKRTTKMAEWAELQDFLDTPKKLEKFLDETVYEAEKEAPWTVRSFFWFTLEGNTRNQSVNLFRSNTIEEDQSFRKNVIGVSANIASFSKKWSLKGSVRYDISTINKFFDNDPVTFITDSLVAGTKYKTSKSKSAYNVNNLTQAEFSERVETGIVTVEGTALYGEKKKYGLTFNYSRKTRTEEAGLRLGAILPVILDNAKAEQSNIILELVMPDIHTKLPANLKSRLEDGDKVWKRSYFNLKFAIPINLL